MIPHQNLEPPESLTRHARKCSVCTHPQRDDIEQDFLHWRSPEKIALAYGIPHHSMIYRHAHALGLFRQRTGLTRHALESIIEQSETCRVTARLRHPGHPRLLLPHRRRSLGRTSQERRHFPCDPAADQ